MQPSTAIDQASLFRRALSGAWPEAMQLFVMFRHRLIASQSADVPFRRLSDPDSACMAKIIMPSA